MFIFICIVVVIYINLFMYNFDDKFVNFFLGYIIWRINIGYYVFLFLVCFFSFFDYVYCMLCIDLLMKIKS